MSSRGFAARFLCVFGWMLFVMVAVGCQTQESEPVSSVPQTPPTPRPNLDIPFEIEDPADRNVVLKNVTFYLPRLPLEATIRDELTAAGNEDPDATITDYRAFNIAYLAGSFEEAREKLKALEDLDIPAVTKAKINLNLVDGNWEDVSALLATLQEGNANDLDAKHVEGLLLFRNHELEAARERFMEVSGERPNDQGVLMLLAVTHLGNREPRKAFNALQGASTIFQNNHMVWYHKGTVSLMERDFREAAKHYRKSNELKGSEGRTLMRLAKSQLRANSIDQGIATLEEYTTLMPTEPAGYLLLAAVYRYQREYQKAANQYQTILRYYPKRRDVNLKLVDVLLEADRFNDAIAQLKKMRQMFPNDLDVLKQLGFANLQLERYEDAVNAFDAATNIEETDPDLWIDLGKAFAGNNQRRPAIDAYNKAKELLGETDATADKVKTVDELIALIQPKTPGAGSQ